MQGGGKEIERVFKHISCRIEAEEAEGVRFFEDLSVYEIDDKLLMGFRYSYVLVSTFVLCLF